MKENKNIKPTELYLGGNNIGDEGAMELVALRENKNMKLAKSFIDNDIGIKDEELAH